MDNNNNHDQSRGRKIFVGGLFPGLTEDEFKNYFEKFGRITDAVVIRDSVTNRPRGFGFITFESAESVESVLNSNFHSLNGKLVEVKRAIPKKDNCYPNSNGGRSLVPNSNVNGGRSLVPNSNVPPPYYGYCVYPPAFAPYQLEPYQLYGNSFPARIDHMPRGFALYNPNSLINPTYPSNGLSDTIAMNGVADTRSVEIKPPKRKLSADAVPFHIKDRA